MAGDKEKIANRLLVVFLYVALAFGAGVAAILWRLV